MFARRVMLWSLVGLAAAFAVAGGNAEAGKKPAPPPPPPPAPGPTDTGLVYFLSAGVTWSMHPEGTAKTALPVAVQGDPGRALHGGHRWFLASQNLVGQTYPGGTITRRELFAVREDGAVATQLTTQPDLMSYGGVQRWAPGDTSISWAAQRWVGGVAGPVQIYTADVAFDGAGIPVGLEAQPASPSVALAQASNHDWSPDGTRLVVQDPTSLWIVDLAAGTTTPLATSVYGRNPAWSPDGARIAFGCTPNGSGAIRTIAPDGTGETSVVATAVNAGISIGLPCWSPNSINLVFSYARAGSGRTDVYRVGAPGSTPVNLTAEVSWRYGALPKAWR